MSWFSDYFEELQKIKAGQFMSAYFLFGDDFYLKENFIEILKDREIENLMQIKNV